MTCSHNKDARILLTRLNGKLRDNNSVVYEKSGPWLNPDEVEISVSGFFVAKAEASAPQHCLRIIKGSAVEEKINEIESILSSCNCYANEKVQRENETSRKNDLINAHREERENIQSQIDGIRSEYGALRDAHHQEMVSMQNQFDNVRNDYKEVVNKQHSLIERERQETSIVRKENSNLQRLLGLSEGQAKQLEIQLADKTNELNQNRQALDRLRQAFLDLSISNATNAERARVVGEQLDWTKGRLVISDNRITTMENRLDQKQQRLEATQERLTNLRITYERETTNKDNEIRNKDQEIRRLKDQAGQTREGLLEEKLHLKMEKLELLAEQLGVNLQQTNNLTKYYERLIEARRNYNQANINTHENNIAGIKQAILNRGVNMRNTQKLCRKCEKVAQLHIELNQTQQQQFEARQQQVPPRRY